MMGNNELEIVMKLNKDMQGLLSNVNAIVEDLTVLTQIVYDREMQKCNDEIDIKLKSHM